MNSKTKRALEKLKKINLSRERAIEDLLNTLPEEVSSTYHFDGYYAGERHPEYKDVFEELREIL